MFSEAFLSTIFYQQTLKSGIEEDGEKEDLSSTKSNQDKVPERRSSGAWSCRVEGGVYNCKDGRPCPQSAERPSQAICIPSSATSSDDTVDLYTSWSSTYATLYQNYPDLHIGGDHILNKKDSGCVLDLECGEDGPVLLSEDIVSSIPPMVSLEGPSGEGLVDSGGESHILPSAPFSNSAINGFLEKKMQELYKQCYEENLQANQASASGLLWHNVLLNINQMSLLMSQEKNLDQAKVKEALLQGLCSGHSSEFLTPNLLISSQGSKKRSNSSHLKKSAPGAPKK